MPISYLRDIQREHDKMQSDMEQLNRHYDKWQGYMQGYITQNTSEWAKLILDHPKATLLIIETTPVVDEDGYASSGDNEPIRLTALTLANGEMWDRLFMPTHSRGVKGTEYHGLTLDDVKDKPKLTEDWQNIVEALADRHIIIFGADYAQNALQTVRQSHILDNAFCLHNKCKEYYGELYHLSLETILSYQNINKTRAELTDSRERIRVLFQVMQNLASGMKKQETKPVGDAGLGELEEHPF